MKGPWIHCRSWDVKVSPGITIPYQRDCTLENENGLYIVAYEIMK